MSLNKLNQIYYNIILIYLLYIAVATCLLCDRRMSGSCGTLGAGTLYFQEEPYIWTFSFFIPPLKESAGPDQRTRLLSLCIDRDPITILAAFLEGNYKTSDRSFSLPGLRPDDDVGNSLSAITFSPSSSSLSSHPSSIST